MIEIDDPAQIAFHRRRAAEEAEASEGASDAITRALHREFAALHIMALHRAEFGLPEVLRGGRPPAER